MNSIASASRCSVIPLLLLFGSGIAIGPAEAAGSPAHSIEKRSTTTISEEAWRPVQAEPAPKVVYGEDDRIDVYQELRPLRRTWAASTCALVSDNMLTLNADGTYSLDASDYEVYGIPACDGEPFADQPAAAFCTGFVVGYDLIATAGHCVDDDTLPYVWFVFGFEMRGADTPVTEFDASQVYSGVEVVARRYEGDYDFSIVRVDRPIAAPGAQILELRRAGTAPMGTKVGVIGHPAGLPTKLAFGDTTVVRASYSDGYFLTNTDSFGGNSGSPVFNAETGLVEGILVFGEDDFVYEEECFRSNVLGDTDGDGEGVSKSATFAQYVRNGQGQVALDKPRYACDDVLDIYLADADLSGTALVTVTTAAGDSESVEMVEAAMPGTFSAEVPAQSGNPTPGDGVVNVQEWETITATYYDADNGEGLPAAVSATAVVDCAPPVISNVIVDSVRGNKARIALETNEPCIVTVRAGADCEETPCDASGDRGTSHLITLTGLLPLTDYRFKVEASDWAGNAATDDDDGACYAFTTTEEKDYFTEGLFEETSDLENLSVTFVPSQSAAGYEACVEEVDSFPTCPTGGRRLFCMGDDGFRPVALPFGKHFDFYGIPYQTVFVGNNGYITFGVGDHQYDFTYANHFALPRISGFFTDLVAWGSGGVSVRQLDDRLAVTYEDILDWWGDAHSFQIELFYDGTIRITWLKLSWPVGIIGLSEGTGIPSDFEPSDLSGYAVCDVSAGGPVDCGTPGFLACNAARLVPAESGPPWTRVAGDVLVTVLAAAVLARGGRRFLDARPRA